MTAEIYVGKNVDVTLQIPAEEDLSSQANGTATQFTVSKTPISDRDMDGVANETAHVTVYVNGSEVTVSVVNDSTGQVTLASAPAEGDTVIIEYRYDLAAYVAQEIRLEPNHEIQGVNGLGSDEIQIWAPLLKEFTGTIREVFHNQDQLSRVGKCKRKSHYSQIFKDSAALNDFEGDTANYIVDNKELKVNANGLQIIGVKTSVASAIKNGLRRDKVKWAAAEMGLTFRWNGSLGSSATYYLIKFDGYRQLIIGRVVDGSETQLLASGDPVIPSGDWETVETTFTEKRIKVRVGTKEFEVIDSSADAILDTGQCGFFAYDGTGDRFDNMEVWIETFPAEYGILVKWDDGSQVRKIGFNKAVFPNGSLPTPKNEPVYVETPFIAESGVLVS